MMINQTYLLFGLLATNAFFLVIVIAALLRSTSRAARLETTMLKLAQTTAAAEHVHAQFARQEKLLRWIAARTLSLSKDFKALQAKDSERRAQIERHMPIEHAVRMARHGASVDDLTRNCGLNIGEARLMQKLHGQTHVSSARH
jgi:hypothetical protein